MPTSITTAPGFTISAFKKRGRPTAADNDVSLQELVSEDYVFCCEQRMTVAFFSSRSCAIGFPTILLLPKTRASLPSNRYCGFEHLNNPVRACTVFKHGSPQDNAPTLWRWNPSTSFRYINCFDDFCSEICLGRGS